MGGWLNDDRPCHKMVVKQNLFKIKLIIQQKFGHISHKLGFLLRFELVFKFMSFFLEKEK